MLHTLADSQWHPKGFSVELEFVSVTRRIGLR